MQLQMFYKLNTKELDFILVFHRRKTLQNFHHGDDIIRYFRTPN